MGRCYLGLILLKAIDAGDDQARGEQGAFDRIGCFAGQEHLLDVVGQRAEEIGQRGAGRGHGQVHLGRERLVPSREPSGEVEILENHEKPQTIQSRQD